MNNVPQQQTTGGWKLNLAAMAVMAWLTVLMFIMASISLREYADYDSFLVSDWMINYSGGFVRRGLAGQVLWWIYQHIASFNPVILVVCVCEVLSAVVLLLALRFFRREGLSLLLLPAGCMFGYTLFGINGRRDFLLLLLAYALFYAYSRLRERRRWQTMIVFQCLSVTMVLFHEASFLFTMPALLLLELGDRRYSLRQRVWQAVLLFMPSLLAVFATVVYKGDMQTAAAITSSWSDAMYRFPDDSGQHVLSGVQALTWSLKDAALHHLTMGYIDTNNPQLYTVVFVIFNFIATFYLVTHINTVFLGCHERKEIDRQPLARFLCLQFFSLLPMFTVLSCDWGRTLPYWVFSSIMLWHFFRQSPILFGTALDRLTAPFLCFSNRHPILSNPWFYLAVLVATPYTECLAPSLTRCSWGLPLKHLLQWLA